MPIDLASLAAVAEQATPDPLRREPFAARFRGLDLPRHYVRTPEIHDEPAEKPCARPSRGSAAISEPEDGHRPVARAHVRRMRWIIALALVGGATLVLGLG